MPYPPARVSNSVDVLHGVPVRDPYRWLEDSETDETIAWVAAQNALTASSIAGPVRDALVSELTSLYDFARTSVPIERNGRIFFTRNAGLQNQPVLYVQEGISGTPRVLLDPNAIGADGTVALTALEPTEDGRFVAYALSRGGSDVQEIYVRDVESSTDLPDRLDWAKFTTISWLKDGSGFYYTRFPQPGTVPDGDEHYFCAVYFHRLGEPQPADRRVFDRPDRREVVFDARVAADDSCLVITAFEGSSDKSEVHLLYLTAPDRTPLPLFSGFDAAYTFIDSADGRLFFRTDRDAPRGQIIAVQSNAPALDPQVIVPEQADKLSTVLIAGDRLVASFLHDASDRVRLFRLDGEPDGEVPLPGHRIDFRPGRPTGPLEALPRIHVVHTAASQFLD